MYIYIMHMSGGYSQGGQLASKGGRMPPPAPPKRNPASSMEIYMVYTPDNVRVVYTMNGI